MTKARLAELLHTEISGVIDNLDPSVLYNYGKTNLLDLIQEEQVAYLTNDTMVNIPNKGFIEASKHVVSVMRKQFALVAIREGELTPAHIFALTIIDCLERSFQKYDAEEKAND